MIVNRNPNFFDLPAHTTRLFAASANLSFFSQAAWYDLMAQNARVAGSEFQLYLDGDPAAVGLLLRTDGVRRLHSITNAYSVEHGPLGQEDDASCAALRTLAREIAAEKPGREAMAFAAFDQAAPSYDAVRDGLRQAGWFVKPFFDCGTWYEETRGLDFRRYFEMRPAMLRNTFRRKEKAAAKEGVAYVFSEEDRDVERLIEDYETVYRNSWKEEEPFPHFMPQLMRLAFRLGALRMGVIRVGDVPAAAQFWIIWRGRAVIYKLAHDERFYKLSLGTLLTMRMMERVLETDHPDEVNYGRGDDPYKKLWLPRRRERWGLYAANPRTIRGAAMGMRWVAGRVRDRIKALSAPGRESAAR